MRRSRTVQPLSILFNQGSKINGTEHTKYWHKDTIIQKIQVIWNKKNLEPILQEMAI